MVCLILQNIDLKMCHFSTLYRINAVYCAGSGKKKTRKNIQLKLQLIKLETLYFLIQFVVINNVRQVEISKS
jgi:hypothetical protein